MAKTDDDEPRIWQHGRDLTQATSSLILHPTRPPTSNTRFGASGLGAPSPTRWCVTSQ